MVGERRETWGKERGKMTEKNEGFGWNDRVEVPESGFELLPDGPAVFEIVKVNRERKEFGTFGVCNVAVMTFLCSPEGGEGSAEVQSQFALVKKLGWKIVKLATACGFRTHGDGNEVDPRWWNAFVGATGRCEIGRRKYNAKKDGKERTANEITDFFASEPGGSGRGMSEVGGQRSEDGEAGTAGGYDNLPF